jgi:alpha-glucosidase
MRFRTLPLTAVSGLILTWPITAGCAQADDEWTVASPDGQLALTVEHDSAFGRLQYRVDRGPKSSRETVLEPSPLGIVRQDQSFVDGLSQVSVSEVETIDETYSLPHGKRSQYRHQARQRVLVFANGTGAQFELIVRAANDGVAFRYRFPENDATVRTVSEEATGFHVPSQARAWICPQQTPFKYGPGYEEFYIAGEAGATAPGDSGWSFPALFEIGGHHWVLVTEAAVDEHSCGFRLASAAPAGLYRIRLPEAAEGLGEGQIEPTSKLPWALPWRVVIVGDLATVVESTLVSDLSPPSQLADTDWIRPGHASWSWWTDPTSPRDATKLKAFVDLAAEMGWEYTLIDAGWNQMLNGNVQDVIEYAKEKGIAPILWYNSGGPHNEVGENPRDLMFDPEIRRAELKKLAEWGVKCIKVDFWHSDKQQHIELYLDVLKDAAVHKILVNFHGCTLPRGWSRTYPHLMTMEAVYGTEQYKFQPKFKEKGAWHNTVIPFTRNVVGPMDYTPVAFTKDKYAHETSYGHELAQSVVFESGIVHMADSVEVYRNLPEEPKAFLKTVPAAWDETRLLAGRPGELVVIARRRAQDWYLGGLNGENETKKLSLDLSFLGDGTWTVKLIADGDNATSFDSSEFQLKTTEPLEVQLLPQGGFVAHLSAVSQSE